MSRNLKNKNLLLLSLCLFLGACSLIKPQGKQWQLVWEEDFEGKAIDYGTWSKVPRGTPDWQNTMADDESLFNVRDGKLILKGIVNKDKRKDKSDFLTGGLWTKGKKGFYGGKLEIRAKLNGAKGAWPAIWLMPFEQNEEWPLEGEVDIMERLNYDNFVYQTVHSNYTQNLNKREGASQTIRINPKEFNTYGVEMREDKVIFYVNGHKNFEYVKDPSKESLGQFPFYREMHLILSMQLGGQWVEREAEAPVEAEALPLEMEIDWVRHYIEK